MIRQAYTFHNYIVASFLNSSVIFSFSLIFQISSKNTSLLKKSILPGGCSGKRGPGDGRDSHFHFNNILLILFLIFSNFKQVCTKYLSGKSFFVERGMATRAHAFTLA